MSFDLFLSREDGSVPAVEELEKYFRQNSFFTQQHVDSANVDFHYRNEVTGVYFYFEQYTKVNPDPKTAASAASCLSFHLNFCRPSFFAYEAMPVVQQVCADFQLNVYDLQSELNGSANSGALIDSWRRSNEWAVRALQKQETGIQAAYLSERKATLWWSYLKEKNAITREVGDDIFVPSVMLLTRDTKRVERMVVWQNGIPQFFPECDWLHVTRSAKGFFGEEEEMGKAYYANLMSILKPHLAIWPGSFGPLLYLPPDKISESAALLKELTLHPLQPNDYTRIDSDSFHDVEPISEQELVS